MSVVGVDFGNMNTVIAVARNRGVDVIANEVSNRATPSLVGFGPKSRYVGEAAKTQEISNLKNTVSCLKRLAGRQFSDPEVEIERKFVTAELVDAKIEVGAKVTYLGQPEVFTFTQLAAMFLTKVKQTASNELKLPVSDIVISVPAWFTEKQRRSIMDAAEIAGLKMLRLMNDITATALGYGITKSDLPLPEEKPRRVAFIDIGHSSYTCSVVAFKKGELQVLSTASDRHFGGRDFDKALCDHFAIEVKEKYKIDITTNQKAYMRVFTAVEKLKKVLSANAQAPFNVESVLNDVDVHTMLKRDELEELVKPLLDRVNVPLEQALADAKLTVDDIDSIELVGGCTRVPAIKERIQQFFGKPLSFTLNQDEAVARGCTYACAILSPVFRVKDFSVHDIVSYPIEFTWEKSHDIPDEETSLTVFPKGNSVPSTKILTFYRKEDFDLEARYSEPEKLPGKITPWIGKFSIKGVHPAANDDFMICKLKARVNLHGVLNLESGYYVEEVEVEEEIKEEADKDAMETDQQAAETKPKTRKVRKQVKKGDLRIVPVTHALDQVTEDMYVEKEHQMAVEDKLVADTEDRKNALEEYIYELKEKLSNTWSNFASEEEKAKLRSMLDAAEDWLYGEGEDATKAVYIAKYEELRAVAGIIAQRYFDHEEAKRQAEAKKRAEEEAKRKAPEDATKKSDEPKDQGVRGSAPQPEVGDPMDMD